MAVTTLALVGLVILSLTPINWADRERFHLFAGFVLGIAQSMEINVRWGGDWNKNWEVDDNQFDDFPHFELLKDF